MFGQKYGRRKSNIGKTSRREISSPEREPGAKGSKSGAPAEIGRYHMYVSGKGCNVENASYGNCVCAERVAIMNAVAHGHRKFTASAVACDIKGDFKGPCGICRQVYAEFGMDIELYLVKPDMTVKKVIVGDLLPMAFTPKSLEAERI